MIKPGLIIILSVLVIGMFLLLPYFGVDLTGQLFTSTPDGTDTCNYSDRDIHAALCVLTGKTLPWGQTEPYIDSLHMLMCSSDGENYDEIGDYYEQEWVASGYTLVGERYDSFGTFTTYTGTWNKGTNVNAVVAGSGAGITSYYGHDTLFITASGPYTTYINFVAFVNSV